MSSLFLPYVIYKSPQKQGSKNDVFSLYFCSKTILKPLYVVVKLYFFSPEPLRIIRIIASTWLESMLLITTIAHYQPIGSVDTVHTFCLFGRCSRPFEPVCHIRSTANLLYITLNIRFKLGLIHHLVYTVFF